MRTTTLLVFGLVVINYLCWGSPIDNKGAGLVKRVLEIDDAVAATKGAAATEGATATVGAAATATTAGAVGATPKAPGKVVAADEVVTEAPAGTTPPAPVVTEVSPDGGKPAQDTPAPPPPPPPVGPSTDKPNSAPPMTQSTAILVLALSTGMFRFC